MNKIEPRTSIKIRKRIVVLLALIFLLQGGIITRYAYLQIVKSPSLKKRAVDQWTQEIAIPAQRGAILDTKGRPLALSTSAEMVTVYMKNYDKAIKDGKFTESTYSEKVSEALGIDKETVIKKLNTKINGKGVSTVVLARRVDREKTNKLRELKLPGIEIYPDSIRVYPNGNLLSHVLGNINVDGNGREGIELKYNSDLLGIAGKIIGEMDVFYRDMPNSPANYINPQNGNDIVLTIDQSIQYFVEKALEKGLVENKAKKISAVVMNVKTGEILAMANKPDYDPNNPLANGSDSISLWRNRITNENFEPGSILKVITLSAALEEGVAHKEDKFYCQGTRKVGNVTIGCWKKTGHGSETLEEILMNSCNIGFMQLGEGLKKENLYKYFNLFGFGKKTNIDSPGEEKGIIPPIQNVNIVELLNQAFGQGIAVTPIQYITALSAIANNGIMMQPHLVKKIIKKDAEGNVISTEEVQPKVVRQTISKETSKLVREMMESVVTKGGSKKAYIQGYHIGSKTGTAQKAIDGRYVPGKYVSSFAAITPIDDPEIALLVSIDEPDPSNYFAAQTALPIGRTILEDILKYLNIKPDGSIEVIPEIMVPEIRGLNVTEGQKILKDSKLKFEIVGDGSIIYDVNPKPGVSVTENTKIVIKTSNGGNKTSKVAVPDFTGKSKQEINAIADSLGIKVIINGEGVATSQDIKSGTEVDKGTQIRLILESPED